MPGQAKTRNISNETWISASDTIGGATPADVHTGYRHPDSRQISNELRGDEKHGLAAVGADPTHAYTVENGHKIFDADKGTRGKSGVDRENVPGAETVAAERY